MIWRRRPRETTQDVKVNIVDPTTFGTRRRVKTKFSFKAKDPFAVHLTFFDNAAGRVPVHWCFARELLIGGITMPDGAGQGDVSIWPLAWDNYRSYVGMILGTGSGSTVMTVAMKPVKTFINNMEKIVSLDSASDHVDMDKELIWLQQKIF